MKENKDKLPLLAKGEVLGEIINKKPGFAPKPLPRTYEEAKAKLLSDIGSIKVALDSIPEKFKIDEYVVCVRMTQGFTAKSFYPSTIHYIDNIENIGARNYTTKIIKDGKLEEVKSKLYFMRTNDIGLEELENAIRYDKYASTKAWCEQIREIHTIDLLGTDEKVLSFDEDWQEGKVEIVLHPLKTQSIEILNKVVDMIAGEGKKGSVKVKKYEDGPIFISATVNKKLLNELSQFNALRTIHPLRNIRIPGLRSGITWESPLPSDPVMRSTIKIGVFDGGVDNTNPLLSNYVNNVEAISTSATSQYLEHGIAVCGAVLYGPLNGLGKKEKLDPPAVFVESFRVLPTSDPADIDLYEVIDKIEVIVPDRQDIKIFNISLGPEGPILDDQISRFTYALDKLSYDHDVLFCVAVGNDGELSHPLNRIQSPADLVNGLGIGAYTYDEEKSIIHAPYSCIGSGREGCKVKPDVVDFGGCQDYPFHVVSTTHGLKALDFGTSLASPLVAGKIGKLMASCEEISPQIARSLIIHRSIHPNGNADLKLGHGHVMRSAEDILNCSQNSVTVLYTGQIKPTQYLKLPITLPDLGGFRGNVTIKWTISILTDPNALDSDGYTGTCLEDYFYPHAYKFKLSHDTLSPKTQTVNLLTHKHIAQELISQGYNLPDFPVSASGNQYKTEEDRKKDFKWDTVVKRWIPKLASSLHDPYLVIHAMGRNGSEDKSIKYSIAISIDIPKYSGKLYDEIVNTYRILEPVKLRSQNSIMVPIK